MKGNTMTNDTMKYCNMINAVDSKLAEISDIIKSYDVELYLNFDNELSEVVNKLEKMQNDMNNEKNIKMQSKYL